MTNMIDVLNDLNRKHRQEIALNMRNKRKAKSKGRNYVFTDLSPITSKFNENQSIKLAKIISMSEAELVELVIKNIDNINI